jgi:hypothetical protein
MIDITYKESVIVKTVFIDYILLFKMQNKKVNEFYNSYNKMLLFE